MRAIAHCSAGEIAGVAGSVQPEEEPIIWEAFAALRALTVAAERAPVLLWAPRHRDRAEPVELAAHERGWQTSRRPEWPACLDHL